MHARKDAGEWAGRWSVDLTGYVLSAAAGQAVVCFIIELEEDKDPYDLVTGLGHLLGSVAVFQLWQAVPVLSSKKEGAPPTDSSFV